MNRNVFDVTFEQFFRWLHCFSWKISLSKWRQFPTSTLSHIARSQQKEKIWKVKENHWHKLGWRRVYVRVCQLRMKSRKSALFHCSCSAKKLAITDTQLLMILSRVGIVFSFLVLTLTSQLCWHHAKEQRQEESVVFFFTFSLFSY